MGRGRALQKCKIAIAGQYREYPYAKVSGWISNLGGDSSTSVTTATTHVVATQKAWRRKDLAIKNALRLNKAGEADIKIVSFDWLEDSVNNKSKKREGPYLWDKLDATLTKQDAAKAREEKAKAKKPKGHVGMMAEVFEESTRDYVDPRDAREIERQIEEEKRVRAAMEEERRLEKEQKRLKHAERFKRGVKKSFNEIFSENHHIYCDTTLFRYEVVCTKADPRINRLARVVLTIYESNAQPHTYAVNYHYSTANNECKNEVIGPMGSSFPAAFRVFKKAFKERTGVEWDDRINAAVERKKNRNRDRGMATVSEDQGSRKGVAVGGQVEEEERKKRKDKEFSDLPFEYQPPVRGPKGLLPKDKEMPEELVRSSNSAVEQWMSGTEVGTPADVQTLIAAHGDEALQATGSGGANNLDESMIGGNVPGTENVLDKDLAHWVSNNLDDQYPFDHYDENVAFLNQSNENRVNDAPSPTATFMHQAETAIQAPTTFNNDLINGQADFSFTNPDEDTNITTHPISFDLPSTIPDSFEPGTQEVTDTQIAEHAQGEFDEFINPASVGPMDSEHQGSLEFGTSILGKRKAFDDAGVISPKKLRQDLEEDEAFAFAAAEAFEDTGGYDLTTSSAFGEDDGIPRVFSEDALFSSGYLTAGTEATEVEDEEVVDYGLA